MPFTLTLVSVVPSRRATRWQYKAVPTATTYPTGGDTVDFTAATIAAGTGHAVPDYPPTKDQVEFNDSCAGNTAEWVKGSTIKNGKIKFFSSAGTELSNATYSAAMQADDLYFSVLIRRGVSQ